MPEIVPEPTPEEREAIERALGAARTAERADRGEWWRQGLRESLGWDEELHRTES